MSHSVSVPLEEVVTLHYGKALSRSERSAQGSVPVYGANGIKDFTGAPLTTGPSWVIGRKGSAGEINRVDGPFWPLDVTYYTSHDEARVEFSYLGYALQKNNLPALARGVKPGINRNDVYALGIALPPLDEQKRIVAILNQAFAALDRARVHAETNLADAQELFATSLESIFREAGSASDTMLLADAVHPDCTLSYGIVQPGGDIEGGLPIVRPVDLKQRIIKKYSLKRISPDRASGYARTRLVGGELLLCVRGSTGEVSVADAELKGANVTRGIVPIRFNPEEVLPEFAYFQFRSPLVRDQIAAKTYGAALMQINIKDLRALSFFVPPIQKQKEMVVRLERLLEWSESLRDNYESQLKDIAALRQSLLQQAFSGKLT